MPSGIYPSGLAESLKASSAGQKWRPSNGTEGEIFASSWCGNCTKWKSDDGCRIRAATMFFSLDDPEYPKQWRIGESGQPECSAYRDRDAKLVAMPAPRCKHTAELF